MMSFIDEPCSSSSSSSSWLSASSRPSRLIKPTSSIYEFGYPLPEPEQNISNPVAYNMVSDYSHSFSLSRFANDTNNSAQEIRWDRSEFESQDVNKPYMIRWKSGKNVDHKRENFFRKIFPGVCDEIDEVFSKIEWCISRKNNGKVKHQTLQRSLSVESPRRPQRFKVKTPGVIRSPGRPHRFKVKTPLVIVIANTDDKK